MQSGHHQGYYWAQWDGAGVVFSTLLHRLPDIALGRYLINTSYDSGSLPLSDEEQQQGWYSLGDLTYSPPISDVLAIPHDQFDEWLVFPEPKEIHSWKPLVNYSGFSLIDPDYEPFQRELWSQIEVVRPESYLSDGDRLIFVTCNQHLHELALGQTDLGEAAAWGICKLFQ